MLGSRETFFRAPFRPHDPKIPSCYGARGCGHHSGGAADGGQEAPTAHPPAAHASFYAAPKREFKERASPLRRDSEQPGPPEQPGCPRSSGVRCWMAGWASFPTASRGPSRIGCLRHDQEQGCYLECGGLVCDPGRELSFRPHWNQTSCRRTAMPTHPWLLFIFRTCSGSVERGALFWHSVRSCHLLFNAGLEHAFRKWKQHETAIDHARTGSGHGGAISKYSVC